MSGTETARRARKRDGERERGERQRDCQRERDKRRESIRGVVIYIYLVWDCPECVAAPAFWSYNPSLFFPDLNGKCASVVLRVFPLEAPFFRALALCRPLLIRADSPLTQPGGKSTTVELAKLHFGLGKK